MKGIDLSCASQASTAICMSMDHQSMVSHGGRAIDRHNPHLKDGIRRSNRDLTPWISSSQPQTDPKPYNNSQKRRKSSSKKKDLISPPGSSRYLLTEDTPFFNVLSDFDPVSALVPFESSRENSVNPDESTGLKPSSSTRSPDQVVVLKVSLHCKGCEGKVRKHISKMEGVTSFSIDFAAKKVTVIGDVTPLSVLTSVSRVKNAKLWHSSSSSSSLSLHDHQIVQVTEKLSKDLKTH